MGFDKKYLLLKEVIKGYSVNGEALNGLVRVVNDGETLTVNISFINFIALNGGNYCAVVSVGGKTETKTIGATATNVEFNFSATSFSTVSVAVLVVGDGASVIAYAGEKEIIETAKRLFSYSPTYDDETVATENYYLYEDNYAKRTIYNETTPLHGDDDEKGSSEEKENETSFNEENAFNENGEILSKVNALLKAYPEDTSLKKTMPFATFIKIDYGVNKFYLFGKVQEEGIDKYVCYALPTFSPNPVPNAIKDYAFFVPTSVFNMQGSGYYVIFQDIKTGKSIKKTDIIN